MRKESLKVEYQKPQGTEIAKLAKKSTTTYIHIGKKIGNHQKSGGHYFIQMNDKLIGVEEIVNYVSAELESLSPEDKDKFTVSIKADKQTPMGIITNVKRELRKAKAYKISYSAEQKTHKK
jgi:biopolymer transport protein ExbD